jgi:hypothetical protein
MLDIPLPNRSEDAEFSWLGEFARHGETDPNTRGLVAGVFGSMFIEKRDWLGGSHYLRLWRLALEATPAESVTNRVRDLPCHTKTTS